jgi:signal transduction histidine kinase
VTSTIRQPSGTGRGTGRVRWRHALLAVSSRAGAAAVATVAIASILAFDWFLLEPEGSFAIRGLSNWFPFAAYTALVVVVVALLIGARRHALEYERGLRRLADEQASLRRVATLVAQGGTPAKVFAAVAKEIAYILGVPLTSIASYEPDGTATLVGAWGRENPFPVGSRYSPHPGAIAEVWRTGHPARVDYASLPDPISAQLSAAGIRSGLGVPIVVDGRTWGVVVALSTERTSLPDDTETRLTGFTELVATAIANTQARDDLRRLADEQAALRRVATLVARAATPAELFASVTKEIASVLDVPLVSLVRYEAGGAAASHVGVWGRENPFPVGTRWTLDERSVSALVSRTGRPARVDEYADVPGLVAARLREAGIRSAVGAPIIVDGNVWGVMMALSSDLKSLPKGTEARLVRFTELVATAISNTAAHDDLWRLAGEQAALRRVATLVARGAESSAVFDAVCEETGRLLGATSVNLAHFTPDGFNLTAAGWSLRDVHVPTGTRLPLEGDTINALVQRTGAPGRFDSYEGAAGGLAAFLRRRGIRSEVGAPVVVEGEVWGALIAGTDEPEPLPPGTELRLASFAELIATAVSNTTTRSELIASRARLVAAADDARRRIERDLHDGTQQRLASLGMGLRAAQAKVPAELQQVHADLDRVGESVEAVLEEVREISRGLHPAMLSRAGLPVALRGLARKSPIPVELEVEVNGRLAEAIEVTTYYVVSEALANVAKHSAASSVQVRVTASEERLEALVRDDGVGGADPGGGSGLIGLADRVEALGGRLAVTSPPGKGTTIRAELPLRAADPG